MKNQNTSHNIEVCPLTRKPIYHMVVEPDGEIKILSDIEKHEHVILASCTYDNMGALTVLCVLAKDNKTLFVPGVGEANGPIELIQAIMNFAKRIGAKIESMRGQAHG